MREVRRESLFGLCSIRNYSYFSPLLNWILPDMSKLDQYLDYFKLCRERFGFLSGLNIFYQLMHGRKAGFKIKGYPHKLYRRPGNNYDKFTFKEIFLNLDYDYDYPLEAKFIIDAGANIGYSAVYFANRFPEAKIVCLEPDDANFELLHKNTENYANITIVKKALWYTNAPISIVNPDAGDRGFMVGDDSSSSTTLDGITVESLMNEHSIPQIDIFKIDIEGAEKEVFDHSPDEWLTKTNFMFVELHDRMKEGTSKAVFKAVSNHDFMFDMKGENLIFYRK